MSIVRFKKKKTNKHFFPFFSKVFLGVNTAMAWKILYQTKPYFCRSNIRAWGVHYLWLTAVCAVHSCPQAWWTWSVLILPSFLFFFYFYRAWAEPGRAAPKETEILEGGMFQFVDILSTHHLHLSCFCLPSLFPSRLLLLPWAALQLFEVRPWPPC